MPARNATDSLIAIVAGTRLPDEVNAELDHQLACGLVATWARPFRIRMVELLGGVQHRRSGWPSIYEGIANA